MNKTLKKLLITVAVIVGICALVLGGLLIFKKVRAKPVNVYNARDFAMTDYWGDSTQTDGNVRTDRIQNVPISSTQTVTKLYVSEGDQVKKGDPLVSFDTTLSDIDLAKAKNSLARLKQDYEDAQKELTNLMNAVPFYTVLVTPEKKGIKYIPEETPVTVSGSGVEDDPLYILWGEEDSLTMDYLLSLFPEKAEEAPEEKETEETERNWDEVYLAFVSRSYDALNAPITNSFGLCLNREDGKFTFRVVEPVLSEEIQKFEQEEEPYYESHGTYTAAELAEMRTAQEQKVHDLELQIKVAEVDLRRLEDEVSDGIVLSKFDGTVKMVRDPDEAIMNGTALMEVSGGGGYYIDAVLSELELDTMEIGRSVTVNSWQSGGTYEGTVVEISEYPSSGSGWSNGNNNVSWYPFTVFVDESAELMEYEYVTVNYEAVEKPSGSWYLETLFVRSEGGKSYVFVQNEDGKLEKRFIQTGKNLWGSYKEIRGGITVDDRVAFPYGKDVVDGAKTREATMDEFYQSAY